MKKTDRKTNNHPLKNYPTIGVCGLDCGLCPRYYTAGPSRCPGCAGPDFFNKHPSCSFITCCVKKKNLEVCAECEVFPCSRFKSDREYQQLKGSSSYPSYKKVFPNFEYIKKYGIDKFIEQQKTRITLLEELLRYFDDGRSRSFLCKAVSFLDPARLRRSLDKANEKIKKENIDKTDVKKRATIIKNILNEIALQEGIELIKEK